VPATAGSYLLGGGRATPQPGGAQWCAGASSMQNVPGVPASAVLGAGRDARGVGLNCCSRVADPAAMPNHLTSQNHFARIPAPWPKRCDRNTLLALRLNGELLTADHGAPLLPCLWPGWYGSRLGQVALSRMDGLLDRNLSTATTRAHQVNTGKRRDLGRGNTDCGGRAPNGAQVSEIIPCRKRVNALVAWA